MASINLYKIEPSKVKLCLQKINGSRLSQRKNINLKKRVDKRDYNFDVALYLEEPQKSNDDISWSWLLNEFQESTYKVIKAPKAVLFIEETRDQVKETYAITFGNSYFKIDKFCDRDFGFNFASRMEYTNIKTTTLTAPNLKRNKTVNTYIDYNELDFNSGESFSKLKVNAKLKDDFKIFKSAIEIGNSIRFSITNETIDGVLDVILYVEKILRIPEENVRYKIPLFQLVKNSELLIKLNQNISHVLTETLLGKESKQLFSFPELEIIGATEIFNHTDDEFQLKYQRGCMEKITHLSVEAISKFCRTYHIDSEEKISKIKIVRLKNGESIVTLDLKSFIEYTDDENKCILSCGKWYRFNRDYLSYLNNSVKEIEAIYNPKYDFSDTTHNQFIEAQYEIEKDEEKYVGESENNIIKSLKRKYYVERCFNMIREQEGDFKNLDRKDVSDGFEKMDLYEPKTLTMFAVKKGKASSSLCYAIDQSLISLKKYKHGEIRDMPKIENVGLWFILERKNNLVTDESNKVDLSSLDMLMLKNRIDQWKKEVRLTGLKPIIYINYRL